MSINNLSPKNKKYLVILGILFFPAILFVGFSGKNSTSETFSQNTKNLPAARQTAEIVELENGDEYALEAGYVVKEIGNRKVRMLAYNGSVPGPFIKVAQGATVKIHFTNNTDLETTIHSHGLRLDSQNDGVPDVSQKPIKPGESFTYELKFPDGGAYWYHPHIRDDYAQEMGLYGSYTVFPKEYLLPPVNKELTLMVDDILFEGDSMPPFYKDRTNFAIMGRFGNVMITNGQTDYEQTFNAGDVVRLSITNTANARPFDISIKGGAKMKLVASDISPYEKEEFVDWLLIGPAERNIVDIYFEKSGKYELINKSHDKSLGEISYHLADFIVEDKKTPENYSDEFNILHEYPLVQQDALQFEKYLTKKPDKKITLSINPGKMDFGNSMKQMPCHKMPDGEWMGQCTDEKKTQWLAGLSSEEAALGGEKIHWEDHTYELNKLTTNKDITWEVIEDGTEKINEKISWKYKIGDVIKLRIFNDPMSAHPMQHPFHIHGQRMMVLATNGEVNENKVWKDTILIPVGDTVDVIVEFSNPGIWMAHCHILEHLHSGMMFGIAVGKEYFDQYDALQSSRHKNN